MLLTGFDSKYLNTLYVDKNLKHHGLIQAFSRTNRVLNDSKPFGKIMEFRQQQENVNQAITLFSGNKDKESVRKIWVVDDASTVIENFRTAINHLSDFMATNGLTCQAQDVNNLKGDEARAGFINAFKEVQRLKTQLNQYTDLNEQQNQAIEQLMPQDEVRSFKAAYLDTAKRLRDQRNKKDAQPNGTIEQLDFEFVLFASTLIDYDYIMALMAKFTQNQPATKQKMTREQLINLLSSSANFIEEREDIIAYINTLKVGSNLNEQQIKEGYEKFKTAKAFNDLLKIAKQHQLDATDLGGFVNNILDRMIFDGEHLSDLMQPLNLAWKDRVDKELALMEDLLPYLKKQAEGREIAGLSAYE